ncbi:MAG: flagellar hook-basal body complex protein FliE [Bacteriovoracia bacterium]
MANMTIENIGSTFETGDMERILDRGRSSREQVANTPLPLDQAQSGQEAIGNTGFSKLLSETLEKVNETQLQADRAVKELAAGRNKNIHETMLLMEKADLSFKMMMQVRNKVIDAYREVMRMQV